MKTFLGYRRADGSVGVRNHVIVINTVGELSGIARKISRIVQDSTPVIHHTGAASFPEDYEQILRTLVGTVGHANVSATLIVAFKNDPIAEDILTSLSHRQKKIHTIYIDPENSIQSVIDEGCLWLNRAIAESHEEIKEDINISEIFLGLECGGSDAWSGITANPSIGECADLLIDDGGTSILAETTEAIGAEHILANNAINKAVQQQFLTIVRNYEMRIKATGEDIRSANPTPGNMAGGLTTLEEKSLGCIKKGGSTPLREVINYSQKPSEKGFVFMDTPGYDVESVCGLVAGGAQIVLFSTGKGSPTGSPIAPVIKIGTNPKVYEIMEEHIDVDAGKIINQNKTIKDIGAEIYQLVQEVANGKMVAAEKHKNQEFAIWRLAESI